MEINSLVQTDNIDVLASVLTYLKQKKLNIIEEIRKKFDDMPNDFESNALVRESEGIDKAGNYALRKMKWLVSAILFLSLTDEGILKQFEFTDNEIKIIKDIA